jgi:hypothetical protein
MAENNTCLYRPKGGRGQARLTPSSTLILAVGIAGSSSHPRRGTHTASHTHHARTRRAGGHGDQQEQVNPPATQTAHLEARQRSGLVLEEIKDSMEVERLERVYHLWRSTGELALTPCRPDKPKSGEQRSNTGAVYI